MKSSLIIPAYNEEEALPLVIEEYIDKVDEIIVVDDGSSDNTYEIAKKYNVKVYQHGKNLGKVAALRKGVENASGEIIIFTDADCTYPAKYVPRFISEIEKGADLVLGSRFLERINNMPFLNIVGNRIFSILATYISCVSITDGQTGFRALKKDMFNKLDVNAKGLEYETKMTVQAAKLGYNIVEIPIEYRKRVGKSKLRPIKDGYKMMKALASVALTEMPVIIKAIMFPSLVLLFGAFYFGVVAVIEMIRWQKHGTPSTHAYYPLLAVFLSLIAIQIFSISLIFGYLTRKLDRIDEKIMRLS